MDVPSIEKKGARFHLIQTSLPYFSGDRNFKVTESSKEITEIATIHRLPPSALSSYNRIDESTTLDAGDDLVIPGLGYQLGQAWFFMDDEAFQSVLVQGYFMENLDNQYFEKVFSNAWGKVYKFTKR